MRIRVAAALILACASGRTSAAQSADTATFVGVVSTDSTNVPIAGAEVSLPDLKKSTLTNERGVFRLTGIPVGTYHVTVKRVGYGPAETSVAFEAGKTVARRFQLVRSAVVLDSVKVKAQEGGALLQEFEEHRKLGLGHFVTRAEIAKLEGSQTSIVLEQIPGLRVTHGLGTSSAWIFNPRVFSNDPYYPEQFEIMKGMKRACYPLVYLDGTLMNRPVAMTADVNVGLPPQRNGTRATAPFDVNSIPPTMIEALEYYASPAQAPGQYAGSGSDCGVLLIHTRK
jgi:hypothetical protein